MAAFRGFPAGVELYATLCLEASAGFEAIRAGYRRAALKTHPDKGGSAAAFQLVSLAFETLSNELLRASYDRWLKRRAAAAGAAVDEGAGAGPPAAESQAPAAPAARARPEAGGARPPEAESVQRRRKKREQQERPPDASQQVSAALSRLRAALQELPPGPRRVAVADLGPALRGRLLRHMERPRDRREARPPRARAAPEATASVVVAEPPSSSDAESSDGSEWCWEGPACGARRQLALGPLPPSAPGPPEPDAAADAAAGAEGSAEGSADAGPAESNTCRRAARGVVRVDWGGARQSYYATLSFAHLKFFTRSQPSFDTALEHHILLAQIRRQAMVARRFDAGAGPQIREACHQVLRESATSVEEMGLRVMVKLELNKKRAGIIVASPVFTLDEAVDWRERLLTDKLRGWETFSAAWVELLQHKGYKRKRPLLSEEAAAFVADRERLLRPAFQRIEEQQRFNQQRRAGLVEEKQMARVQRAARRAEAALGFEAAAARRTARELLLRRRRLRERRWRWLHRVKVKDMTLQDLMQGFPADLRGVG